MAAIGTGLPTILQSAYVTRAISRIKTPQSRFTQFFGMSPGGPATSAIANPAFSYDIFDKTRDLADVRGPASAPARKRPQFVGNISGRVVRLHESIPLVDAYVNFLRPIGGQWGEMDARGQSYITKQEEYLAQKFANTREFMISRMLRGGFSLLPDGESLLPVDIGTSGAILTVNYQVADEAGYDPAVQNAGQLPLGTGADIISTTWSNAAADIPKHCLAINAAFEKLHGRALTHVWINSTVFNYVQNNTAIKALAGTANQPFEVYIRDPYRNEEGMQDPGFQVRFRALPWLTWHVYDAGLNVNGTFTKFLGDTQAVFLPDPSAEWAEMLEGPEWVRENVLDPGTMRNGFYAWVMPTVLPAGFELIGLDNCIPMTYNPKLVANGTVVF